MCEGSEDLVKSGAGKAIIAKVDWVLGDLLDAPSVLTEVLVRNTSTVTLAK